MPGFPVDSHIYAYMYYVITGLIITIANFLILTANIMIIKT